MDRKITIDDLQNKSIEEIVQLYQQGYILDESTNILYDDSNSTNTLQTYPVDITWIDKTDDPISYPITNPIPVANPITNLPISYPIMTNKELTNNELSLEYIRNKSIDDIVELYRQGYRLGDNRKENGNIVGMSVPTTYRDWKVNDTLAICASINPFCGSSGINGIVIDNINVDKFPNQCSIPGFANNCGIDINNIGITFKLVRGSPDTNCNVPQVFKTLGEYRTNSQGVVATTYTVTEQDRLDYNTTVSQNDFYYIIACVTDGRGQLIIDKKEACQSITISLACSISCVDAICGADGKLYYPICVNNNCVPDTTRLMANTCPTNYIDIKCLPFTWSNPDNLLTAISEKLIALNGALLNLFTGLTGWQYLGVTAFKEAAIDFPIIGTKDGVTIRIYLKNISTAPPRLGSNSNGEIVNLAVQIPWALLAIVTAGFIAITVGLPLLFGLKDYITNLVSDKKQFTPSDVSKIIWGGNVGGEQLPGVVQRQLDDCAVNCGTDTTCYKNCSKSIICGAADGSQDFLRRYNSGTNVDCTTQQVNQKVDNCYTQYPTDMVKLKECIIGVKATTGTTVQGNADNITASLGGGNIFGTVFLILAIAGAGYIGIKLIESRKK